MIWKFLSASIVALLGLGSGYFLGHSHGYKDAYVEYRAGFADGKFSEQEGADLLEDHPVNRTTRTGIGLEASGNQPTGRRRGVSDHEPRFD